MMLPASEAKVGPNPLLVGFGRPGTRIKVMKKDQSATVYADGIVPPNGRWEITATGMQAAGTYVIGAMLYEGSTQSGWGDLGYSFEVVTNPPSQKKRRLTTHR
jgi:hypothetical protein